MTINNFPSNLQIRLNHAQIRAKAFHNCREIDLVDMIKVKLEHKGKCYKYILSVLDNFQDITFEVKEKLEQMHVIHGMPKQI